MGETETHHFYDFAIFGRVTEPQNRLFLYFETPGDLNEIKKHHWNIKNGNRVFCQCWTRRAPTNPDDSSNNILKILDMRSISLEKYEKDNRRFWHWFCVFLDRSVCFEREFITQSSFLTELNMNGIYRFMKTIFWLVNGVNQWINGINPPINGITQLMNGITCIINSISGLINGCGPRPGPWPGPPSH